MINNLPDEKEYKKYNYKLTPFKLCVLQNFPFIEADFDAITNYQLLCKVVEYLNHVIDNQNTVEDNFKVMADNLNTLYNYLDTLDLQDEVNNKLDEMVEDGKLEQIIEQYINSSAVWCFDTVADMKEATNLINGSYAKTTGYYSINDGGGALYRITNSEDSSEFQEELSENLYATLISNGTIYIKQFGAKGDGETDDSEAIQNALKYHENNKTTIIFNEATQYNIKGKLYLYSNTDIDFNNQKIKIIEDNTRFLNYGYYDLHLIENISFKNGYFDGYNETTYCYLFKFALLRVNNLIVENNTFYCVSYHGHTFDLGGCTNVIIKDNYWHNVYNAENSVEAELIQLDVATYNGLPYWEEESEYYNGQACKNIVIENNRFKQDNKNTYGRMNAIGSHSYNYQDYQENIKILGNTFDDPAYANIKINSWKNVIIENNVFNVDENYAEPNPINTDSLYNIYIIFGRDNVNPTKNSENIKIINNTINNKAHNNKIIPIWINGLADNYHKNITIQDNMFNGSFEDDTNKGAMFLQFSRCGNLNIANNIINKARSPFYSLNTSENITISNNLINNCKTEFYFTGVSNLKWESNLYTNASGISNIKSTSYTIPLTAETVTSIEEGYTFKTDIINNNLTKEGDIVNIQAMLTCNVASDNLSYDVMKLPVNFRPSKDVIIHGYRGVNNGYGLGGLCTIQITSSGMVKVRNNTGDPITILSINACYNVN